MPRPIRLLPLLPSLITALSLAGAVRPALAQTYKIIGPDGRVTFSDRKPTDPQQQSMELGRALPQAPLFTPGALSFEPQDARTVAARRPRPSPFPLRPPIGASGEPYPPALADAVLNVVGRQQLVQSMWELCMHLGVPQERYDAAAAGWRKRNAPLLDKTDRIVFSFFTTEQRDLLRATAQSQLQSHLAPVNSLAPIGKITWCDKSADDLTRGTLDVANETVLSVPIMNFTLRN
jgi:hypothetical protein